MFNGEDNTWSSNNDCDVIGQKWDSDKEHNYTRQLAASQARELKLREALKYTITVGNFDCDDLNVIDEALSTISDDTALREHDAKLVERIAGKLYLHMFSNVRDWLLEIADQIRKGNF